MTQVTGTTLGSTRFPYYDGALLGIEGYWYPVMHGRDLGSRPTALKLFGHDVVFLREQGRAYALEDRCPHRGVPLSLGKCEFPGTLSCRYHGWTFDVATGTLVAALTDGPESPICGKARVKVFPVEERFGIIWLYHGSGPPPPLDPHVPSELRRTDAVIEGRITERPGDWRYAAENGFDEGHAKYLHRNALIMTWAAMPAYSTVTVEPDDESWITRRVTTVDFQGNFPGLGVWPPNQPWRRKRKGSVISIRMPGVLRVDRGNLIHVEWYVPTVNGRHRYLQFVVQHRTGLRALLFRAYYWLWFRWIFHVLFNDQDASMVELMKTPPERLYRPDISLIAWRQLFERSMAGEVSRSL